MNEKILVVENEQIVANDVKRALEKNGFQVVGLVANAQAALMAISQNQPDLIVLDILLDGEMDGIDFAKEISQTYPLPIVFLTANSNPQMLQRIKSANAFGYILKPFKEKELCGTIEIALNKFKSDLQLAESLNLQKQISHKLLHTSAQLEATSKNLEKANERMTILLRMIQQDLKTPFANILDFVDQISQNSLNPGALKACHGIRETCYEALKGLNRMMEIAELEKNNPTFEMQALNFAELAGAVTQPFWSQAIAKNINLQMNIENTAEIKSDAKRLKLVLTELLGNALKFTPQKGKIHFRAKPQPQGLVVEISDDGPGINAHDLQNLFVPEVKLNNPLNVQMGGLGWGLKWAYSLLLSLDSQLKVVSKLNEGSCFYFVLPWLKT